MGINWDNFSKEVKTYQNKIRKNEMKISHLQHEINEIRYMQMDEKEKSLRIIELEEEVLNVEIENKIYRKKKEVSYFKNIDNPEIIQYRSILKYVTEYYCTQTEIEAFEKACKALAIRVKLGEKDKKEAKTELKELKEFIELSQEQLLRTKLQIEKLKKKNEFLKNLLTVTFDDVEVLGEDLKNKYLKDKIDTTKNKKKAILKNYQNLQNELMKLENAETEVKSEIEKRANQKLQQTQKEKVRVFSEISYKENKSPKRKNKHGAKVYVAINNQTQNNEKTIFKEQKLKESEAAQIKKVIPERKIIMMKSENQVNDETLDIATSWVSDVKNNMSFINSFKRGEKLSEVVMDEIARKVRK